MAMLVKQKVEDSDRYKILQSKKKPICSTPNVIPNLTPGFILPKVIECRTFGANVNAGVDTASNKNKSNSTVDQVVNTESIQCVDEDLDFERNPYSKRDFNTESFQSRCSDPRLQAWLEFHYPLGGRLREDTVFVLDHPDDKSKKAVKRRERRKAKLLENAGLTAQEKAVKAGFGIFRGPKFRVGEYVPPCRSNCYPFGGRRDGIKGKSGQGYIIRDLINLVGTEHWRESMSMYRGVYTEEYFNRFGASNQCFIFKPLTVEEKLKCEFLKSPLVHPLELEYGQDLTETDLPWKNDSANDALHTDDFLPWDKTCKDSETGISLMPSQAREPVIQDTPTQVDEGSSVSTGGLYVTDEVLGETIGFLREHTSRLRQMKLHKEVLARNRSLQLKEACDRTALHKENLIDYYIQEGNLERARALAGPGSIKFNENPEIYQVSKDPQTLPSEMAGDIVEKEDSLSNINHGDLEKYFELLTLRREAVEIPTDSYDRMRFYKHVFEQTFCDMFEEEEDFYGPPKPLWLKGNSRVINTSKILVPKSDINETIPVYARWFPSFAKYHNLEVKRRFENVEKVPFFARVMNRTKEIIKRNKKPIGFSYIISDDPLRKGKKFAIPQVHIR